MPPLLNESRLVCGLISQSETSANGEHGGDRLTGTMAQGKLRHCEHGVQGVHEAPRALVDQLKGQNVGKVNVKMGGTE